MSNWASITSADFAIGAYFHQPAMTDVHPALRKRSDPSQRSRSSTTDTITESSTASESGSYFGPDTPTTIDDLSHLHLDGGADKVPLPTDAEGYGLIPLYEEPGVHQPQPVSKQQVPKSPPKARYVLFPPPEQEKSWARPPLPQRKPSDTSSHTSFSDSVDLSGRNTNEFARLNAHSRSMSHDGQYAIQPDNFYGFSRAQATPSPPPHGYFTPGPMSHHDQITPQTSSFSPKFNSNSAWDTSPRKHKNRSMSLPVSSFKKLLKKGSTPLIEAAKMGDYNELLRLLAPGPQNHPISAPDRDGFTALHHSVRLGYIEIARALVLRHADIEARTKSQDRTPLWFASHAGQAEIVEMLLEQKANPNAISKMDGAAALHKASQQGNEEIMRLLIRGGADVNLRDVEGMTPLMWATQSKRMSAARLLILQGASLETRIKLGANLELSSKQGLTVLQKAVNSSDHALAELFLEMGADPNCWGPNGLKPLHKAASRGDVNMCNLLLDAGAEAGTRTTDGWTALHFAARYGHADVADLLVKKGCEPLVVNGNGETARQVAEKYGYHNVV